MQCTKAMRLGGRINQAYLVADRCTLGSSQLFAARPALRLANGLTLPSRQSKLNGLRTTLSQ